MGWRESNARLLFAPLDGAMVEPRVLVVGGDGAPLALLNLDRSSSVTGWVGWKLVGDVRLCGVFLEVDTRCRPLRKGRNV